MEGIQITKEELQKVTKRYNEIEKSFEEGESLKTNMLNAYMAARPESGKEEASALIDKLLDGSGKLTRMYNEALEKGDFDVRSEIDSIGMDMSVEERFHLIVNTLAVVETINLSTYDSLTDAKKDVEKAIEDYLAKTPAPTQADCDAILDVLADAIKNNTVILSGAEKARGLLDAAHKGDMAVIDFASEQYDDARVKAGMALAMWLAYEDGQITSMPENTTPESIGVGAATAVEQAKITSDVASGKKTVDVAVKCLKILGGVALTCLLVYGGILALVYVGSISTVALLTLLGTSTLAVIATTIAVFALLMGVTGIVYQAGSFILEKAGQAYDIIVEKLRETVIPAIRKGIAMLINWIKLKMSSFGSNIIATN